MKKLLLLLVAFTILFSCDSGEGPEDEPTIEEIQQDIHNTFDAFVACTQNFEEGRFSSSFQNFFLLNHGETNSEYADELADELDNFDFDLENFSMSDHSGVYNWDANLETWLYTENTSNKLVFNFPFTSTQTVNNTTITIDNYTVQEFMVNGDLEYYPTKLLGSIQKDNNEIFNIDFDNATYTSTDGDITPTNFELEIRTSPMTHTYILSQNSSNQLEFDYSAHNDNGCETTFSIDASSTISNITLIEDLDEFNVISGNIGHGNLDIRFNADVNSLGNLDEPTVDQINQFLEAKVYLGNSEIGELEYSDENDDIVIYILFSDGTRENVTNYVNDDLANQLETVFANFMVLHST